MRKLLRIIGTGIGLLLLTVLAVSLAVMFRAQMGEEVFTSPWSPLPTPRLTVPVIVVTIIVEPVTPPPFSGTRLPCLPCPPPATPLPGVTPSPRPKCCSPTPTPIGTILTELTITPSPEP